MNNLLMNSKIEEELSDIHNLIIEIFNTDLSYNGLEKLHDSALYHFSYKGKMIRPGIMISMSHDLGVDINLSKIFAVSLELIHNYSLIHDDLPCMDDDDYRRGQLSVHKKFDEATAVLLGDYFLNKSIEYITENLELFNDSNYSSVLKSINTLYLNSGSNGMLGGQFLDLNDKYLHNETNIIKMYKLKTAALFKSAFLIPGFLANSSDLVIKDLDILGAEFGVLFQLLDDLDDKEEDIEKTTIYKFKNDNEVDELISSKVNSVETIFEKHGLNITKDYLKDFYEKKS